MTKDPAYKPGLPTSLAASWPWTGGELASPYLVVFFFFLSVKWT